MKLIKKFDRYTVASGPTLWFSVGPFSLVFKINRFPLPSLDVEAGIS
ncbi:hypothetical protein BKA12_002029 [Neomicrococcus lactis]|uniref:Uncharacterized protein n=1 Tax=Neomicrococcus lactis TaxID=732241 RepID=A0A7W8YCE3_9MICC|nr:hypothetical protein [Neomicrococcus lactis]